MVALVKGREDLRRRVSLQHRLLFQAKGPWSVTGRELPFLCGAVAVESRGSVQNDGSSISAMTGFLEVQFAAASLTYSG